MTFTRDALAKLGATALTPDLWRIALPFPSPLGYSFSYLVRVDDGWIAVDLGWDTDDGWDLFNQGLNRAGASLAELLGVVITHAHPDHYGMARRVHESSDAWIALHPSERPQITRSPAERQQRLTDIERWLARLGVPGDDLEGLLSDRAALLSEFPSEMPDRDLVHDQAVHQSAGQLTAIHTPGHTPGHMVFVDRRSNTVFTGDHLLPRISANVSERPTSDPDPLGDYADSLDRLTPYAGHLAAPGHEWSFGPLGERVDVIRAHHNARLEEVWAAVASGHTTAWEVAHHVPWSRPFDTLNARGRRSALGETSSHLVRLQREGRLTARPGSGPSRWTVSAAPRER